MQRAQMAAFLTGILLLALSWPLAKQGPAMAMRNLHVDGGAACPAAPVLELAPADSSKVHGSVVVFHGIGANRLIMLPLGRQFAAAGFRVYLVDSPGHGVNTAPFSFAANEACGKGLLARLESSREISARKTLLAGHSMGGGQVIRLADDFLAAGTIAIAAAPVVRPHRMPENLLLVAPQFDMPPILAQEREFAAAAGSTRDAPEDFRQSRAFRLLRVSWQSHTSPIFSGAATEQMVRWALNSAGSTSTPVPPTDYGASRGALLGLAGILLLFPAWVELCAKLGGIGQPAGDSTAAQPRMALLAWTGAGMISALVLGFWMPLSRLHLFGGDYLASFLLIAGLPLAVGFGSSGFSSAETGRDSIAAVLVSLVVSLGGVVVIGWWCSHGLAELWLIPARWARLPLLAAALLPAAFAEECVLGSAAPWFSARGAGRIFLHMALRGILWTVMLAAYQSGASSALFPVIYAAPLAGVSFGARLGADLVRDRTGSPAAAASFGAILMAWFVAAAFPLA